MTALLSAECGFSAVRPVHPAGSQLIVLVFEQDVERGERSVTARDVLSQVELVRFARFMRSDTGKAQAKFEAASLASETRYGQDPRFQKS